jgi:hypothetical protein
MKPLREFSTEQLDALADDELIDLVANDIQSSRVSGADLEEEHIVLAPWAKEAIRALWREEKTRRQSAAKPVFRRITGPDLRIVACTRFG